MTHNRPPTWVFIGLAVLVLFGIGAAIHNAGWSQGFTWGLMAAGNTDSGALTPYLAYRTGYGMHPFGGGFGCLFPLALLIFLGVMAAKFFGCGRWQQPGGPSWRGQGWRGPWGEQPVPAQPQPEPGAGPTPTAAVQPGEVTPQRTPWIDV